MTQFSRISIAPRLFFSLCALLLSTSSFAHFHYEAALNTHIVAEKQADKTLLKSLDISLTYDLEVSQIYLEDNNDLNDFAQGLLKDLAPLGYFTKITMDDKSLKTAKAINPKAVKIGKGKDALLKVSYTLPLIKPVELKGKVKFKLIHVDSTESATLYYDTPSKITFSKVIEPDCIADIKEIADFKQGEQPQNVNVVCEIK